MPTGTDTAVALLTEAGDILERRHCDKAASYLSQWCLGHLADKERTPLADTAIQLHQQRRQAAFRVITRQV